MRKRSRERGRGRKKGLGYFEYGGQKKPKKGGKRPTIVPSSPSLHSGLGVITKSNRKGGPASQDVQGGLPGLGKHR
jgi:hypothetical protein